MAEQIVDEMYYECGCLASCAVMKGNVVVYSQLSLACPEHGKPVRPVIDFEIENPKSKIENR